MKEYFSPGRINIIGEHIDYNGGNVFPSAIDLGTKGFVELNNENIIRFNSKNIDVETTIEVDFTKPFEKTTTWADYMIGVLDVFRNHGYENKVGFNLVIDSNLPNGAGLSSSACIEVLMAVILNDLNNFNLTDEQISLYAQQAENDFVGVNCGIMDQFIIANGVKDCALLLNTSTLKFDAIKINLNDYKIVILNSNKRRGLVDSAYNERREQCNSAREIIKAIYNVADICNISTTQLEEIKDKMENDVYKRALHATSEQERVTNAINALNKNNIEEFANYITQSHYSMKDNFEASCEELDFIVEKSIELGAAGARMIGAGFGGCAIAIIKEENLENLRVNLPTIYNEKYDLVCDIYDVNIVDKCMRVGE